MKKKYLIFIPIIILFVISFIYLPNNLKYKELSFQIISILLCIYISNMKFNKILKYSILYYILSIILLILVLVINKYTNGSRAWIDLKIISIQPSELVKISLILLTYKYLNKLNIYTLTLLYFIPLILIYLEPDTGGVLINLIIYFYFLLKKLNKKQLIKLLIITLIFLSIIFSIYFFKNDLIYRVISPYRLDRLLSFINGNNLQTNNALISIAVSNTLYFPEMYNDFFISYILSNNIYLLIIINLCIILILIYLNKKNTIISQVVFYLILFQCYYNILMNLSLVPVIGIPFLFISYGGSHLITYLILIGVIINNSMDNYNMA